MLLFIQESCPAQVDNPDTNSYSSVGTKSGQPKVLNSARLWRKLMKRLMLLTVLLPFTMIGCGGSDSPTSNVASNEFLATVRLADLGIEGSNAEPDKWYISCDFFSTEPIGLYEGVVADFEHGEAVISKKLLAASWRAYVQVGLIDNPEPPFFKNQVDFTIKSGQVTQVDLGLKTVNGQVEINAHLDQNR